MPYGFNDDRSKFDLSGIISSIADIISTLNGKSDAGHKHAASDITSGTLPLARGGTGVTSVAALRNLIGYKNYETLNGSCRAVGYVTNGGKTIRFTIPLSLPIATSHVNLNDELSWTVRQNGNYLFGSADGNVSMSPEPFTLSRCPSGVNIEYTTDTVISNAANNAEVAIQVTYSFLFG
jgi:hypothetical protein